MIKQLVLQVYNKATHRHKSFGHSSAYVTTKGQSASDLIRNHLEKNDPLMITRFGTSELHCILNYLFIKENKNPIKHALNLARGITFGTDWRKYVVNGICFHAGLFPNTLDTLDRYVELSLADLKDIDILGSWLAEERFVCDYMQSTTNYIQLEELNSYNHNNPWTEALEGKKVLVVHPFSETIKSQYKNRKLLFADERVLPAFDLKTIKAVQSIAGNNPGFDNWFDALNAMTDQVESTDFDVALVGCGSYGMPLAARIKRMGKQAIHLGGATQCLFGIKGARWEMPGYASFRSKFFNDYWVRPSESETPLNSNLIEDNSYW